MTIDSAFYSHLSTHATLTAVVSTRIYPDVAPQGETFPYVVFSSVAEEHERHAGGGAGLARVNMQIDVYAESTLERRTVVDILRERLHGFRGAMGAESLAVRSCAFDGPIMSYEPPSDGEEFGIFRGRCAADIWHVESVPTFP